MTSIYSAARASDDGNRCAVAPHPDLRDKINKAIEAAKTAGAFPSALRLRASEPRLYGLNDGTIFPSDFFPFDTPPSVMRAAAAERAPLRGTLRVIVVLVDFSDKPMVQTQNHFRDLFFSQNVLLTKSVREYYHEVTNGLIDIQGDVVGPFRLPQSLATYAHGASGMGTVLPNAQTMARDALVAADPTVNFSPYDNDGNGFVDAFIVIHAGPGAEVTGSASDIWSHKWVIDGGARHVDNTSVFGYLTVPEDCKIGVCAHELGHLLFGFPDLYDTDGSSEGIGNWCLMAAGSWGGGGDTPVHPSAWCKANQGWVGVDNRMANAILNIPDVKSSHTVYRLWKNGGAGNEYFLVENRQQTGFDVSLPGAGLLVWHIDEGQPDNTNENHYKVALLQADNRRDLELNHNRGDAGDCYPGSSNNTTLNLTSSPNTKSYAGAATCVSVTGISAAGPVMTANLQVKCLVKIKEHKEIKEKDRKDIKEKDRKDIKESIEKPVVDHPGKPVIDKQTGLDKGFDGKLLDGKFADGRPGGGGLGGGGGEQSLAALEARIAALESAAAMQSQPTGHSAMNAPFIGQELRPDLSQSAFSEEEDQTHLREQMQMGSAHAKRVYDSKIGG
ncbi:M6 family metalloprotease domain-containing protein [Paraburkholderia sp. Se-20369]|nr:M6 family metalloprotease domain-containing protein [Paraburkholderia sp. Se-20369]